jgi:hypothetical protein
MVTAVNPGPTVEFTSDLAEITAGVDEASVTVTVSNVDPLPSSITVLVGEAEEAVTLTSGIGTLSKVTAESGKSLEINVKDSDAYWSTGLVIGVKYAA